MIFSSPIVCRSGKGTRWMRPGRQACNWRGGGLQVVSEEEGSSLIEFVISLTALMTFLFVLMELCIAFYTHSMIAECAREGTRWAIVRGSTCETSASTSCTATKATIQNYVLGLGLPNPGGATMVPVASFPDGDVDGAEIPGHKVQVYITYTFPIRFPFVPRTALTMTAMSQMIIVQ